MASRKMSEDERQQVFAATLRAMPGYPWLPCPICKFTESCDHTGSERARAAGFSFGTETVQ